MHTTMKCTSFVVPLGTRPWYIRFIRGDPPPVTLTLTQLSELPHTFKPQHSIPNPDTSGRRGLRPPEASGGVGAGGVLVARLVLHATFLHFHVLVIHKYSLPIFVHMLQRSPLVLTRFKLRRETKRSTRKAANMGPHGPLNGRMRPHEAPRGLRPLQGSEGIPDGEGPLRPL